MKINYIPKDEAREAIKERRDNECVQEKLLSLTGGIEPGFGFSLDDEPSMIFAEYVARPTMYDIGFAREAQASGLIPTWATYLDDSFVTANRKKVDMLRPPLALPKGQNSRQWIVETAKRQRSDAKIGRLATKFAGSDQTVSDYWMCLRKRIMTEYELYDYVGNTVDLSESYSKWAQARRETGRSIAVGYYPAILGLYAARAVLYVKEKFPSDFATRVAEPAYENVVSILGVEPLIVNADLSEDDVVSEITGRSMKSTQVDLTYLSEEEARMVLEEGRLR